MSTLALFVPRLTQGGAEQVMVDLANGFSATGHVVCLTAGWVDRRMAAGVASGVSVHSFDRESTTGTILPLARFLREVRPAALLATLSAGEVAAALAKIIGGAHCRLVLREANTPSLLTGADRSVRGECIRRLLPWAYRSADHVIGVSAGVARDIVRFGGTRPDHVSVIYNPVLTDRVIRLAGEPLTDSWFDPGGPPVVVAMGRLTEQKDFGTLVRAFAILAQSCDARLVILGEGERRVELEELIRLRGLASRARLLGWVENPFPYLRLARLFVLSSRWEGLPNSLIQALALGCPVVSTDCMSGPEEILEGGRFGELVPVGNAPALSEAMARALARPRGEMTPALAVSLKRFEDRMIVDSYLRLLIPDEMAAK